VGPTLIPEDLDEEDVLFLSDVLPAGYQAAEMGDIKPGETVAIFGAGPVGLFAARSAWLMGAGRVIMVDREDYRLEFARQWANVETVDYVDAGRHDVVGALRAMTERRGPDVCIDAVGCDASGSLFQRALGGLKVLTGTATSLGWAIQSVRRGGHVVAIGAYAPPWNLVPVGELMNKGITLRSAECNVKRYLPRLVEHIREGRLDPTSIITHRGPLEAGPDLYEIFAGRKEHCIKCVLVPDAA
jgi:threonine dehydrogenase-like Zn-dependent dehydrogenase